MNVAAEVAVPTPKGLWTWRWAALALTVLGAGSLAGAWWVFQVPRTPLAYEISHRAGDVTIERNADGGEAIVRTGSSGFATLQFEDGSELRIMPGSHFTVESALKNRSGDRIRTRVRLDAGEAQNFVKSGDGRKREYTLGSKSIQIGVRGTVFTIIEDAGAARLMVTRGNVEAAGSQGAPTPVSAGQGVVVAMGKRVPAPSQLPLPPMLDAPASGAEVDDEEGSLSWHASLPGHQWQVQIATDMEFTALVRHATTAENTWRLKGLSEDGAYFWRVASIDHQGLRGDWSEGRQFDYAYFFARGRQALLGRDRTGALEFFKQSGRDNAEVIEAVAERGRLALSAGRLNDARSDFALVNELRPRDMDILAALADAQYWLNELDAARQGYLKVLQTEPGHPGANLGAARLDYKDGDFEAALGRLRVTLESAPANLEALELSALLSVNTKQLEQAMNFVAELLRLKPGHRTGLLLRDGIQRRLNASLQSLPSVGENPLANTNAAGANPTATVVPEQ